MLRKFKIKLNEKEYVVEMEELTPGVQMVPVQAPVAQSVATQPVAALPAKEEVAPSALVAHEKGEGQEITAPMPGNILKVSKQAGDHVSKNEPVVVLEAMKMENEIVSPIDGTLTSIMVSTGQFVDVSEVLFTVQA